jgi:hypothetical protein
MVKKRKDRNKVSVSTQIVSICTGNRRKKKNRGKKKKKVNAISQPTHRQGGGLGSGLYGNSRGGYSYTQTPAIEPHKVTFTAKDFTCGTEIPRKLSKYFGSKEFYFNRMSDHVLDGNDKARRRIFIDNKAPILFVAHLDTVLPPAYYGKQDPFPNRYKGVLQKEVIEKDNAVFAVGLDDRLGFFTAMSLVYHDGINADILLTDNEEQGESTAMYHRPKSYNMVVEFDRAGDDVVTYDKHTEEFKKALKSYWGTMGHGAFSDITTLSADCCCVNVGIGYHSAHCADSWFDLQTYSNQIAKLKLFLIRNKNLRYPFDIRNYINGRLRRTTRNFGNTVKTQTAKPVRVVKQDTSNLIVTPKKRRISGANLADVNSYLNERHLSQCEYCYGHGARPIFGKFICIDCFNFMESQSDILTRDLV